MRMRAGVWWSAAALTLLAVTSALRTTQVEGVTRTGRRLPAPSAPDGNSVAGSASTDSLQQPTFRPRSSRRREESTQKDTTRIRTRTRPEVLPTTDQPQPPSVNNERFDSRKTRTRSQTTNNESNKDTSLTRDRPSRTRSRGGSRRPTSTTQAPVDLSSPTIDESRLEVINSNLDDITKITTEATATTHLRRRSSVTQTTESVAPKRSRGRVSNRTNARSLDLDVSGTTNTLSVAEKAPTTARTAADLRNSRKLRYKTRPSETDANLTGEGLVTVNEVIKSSQNKESVASQAENQTPVVVETIVRQSTEPTNQKTTTLKVTKVVRRPLGRGKVNFRPTITLPKPQVSDEISEDDNYPASFKALIQAKNSSTQESSPTGDSLSPKASQKVYKTYPESSQSTQTGPGTNKYSRLRNKQTDEATKSDKNEEAKTTGTTEILEVSRPRISEYKPRGTYTPRSRKSTFAPSSTISSTDHSTEKPAFKYSRKFKASTTESTKTDIVKSKTVEPNNAPKKTFVRPPVYSRKYKAKAAGSSETSSTESVKNEISESIPHKTVLPRTSYYARLRNNQKNDTSFTTESLKEADSEPVTKKPELVDSPLVFSLFNNSEDGEAVRIDTQLENKDDRMFLISVTSKESLESNNSNEVSNMAEESENMPVVTVSPTISRSDTDKYKYHANYKDQNSTNDIAKEKGSSTVFPPVRNLQTRKYGRNRGKSKNGDEDVKLTTPIPRERSLRKFSESFSKTTEASTNGITPEPDKSKSRFSSKYRASYIDKPFYKPTVPTITPSTAWLKFYVTDHLLTKSVEEPNWFEGELYTTESMSRLNDTTPYFHESSIELVEGEEIQLGSGLNAISFTQTRRTLSSEDLRLSESLVKPSHVMNVEASNHSPSVTVSIFDALAEILTSTPKPRLSSTTEVTKIQNINTDDKQVLNGVSSNINVNSVEALASQDTFISTTIADVSTTTKSVQPTVQATPNVINRILVGGSVTQSLNTDDGNKTPVNTLPPPIPTPSTPVSARKPFAIRVLYSETEPPTDKPTTASTPNQGSTDSPKMVYNTVSDLLLSNNNLVSSELTSMLSNNIINIIENMDENSRSKLRSLDMAKVLKSLIPRALDGLATVLDNADSIPITTPYSLEDIRDTENIDIDNIESYNALQNVESNGNVNITVDNRNVPISVTQNPANVNSPVTLGVIESTMSVSNSQATIATTTLTAGFTSERPSSAATPNTMPTTTIATSPVFLETDSVNVASVSGRSIDSTNNVVPLPFLTNFQSGDFTSSDADELGKTSATSNLKSSSIVPPSPPSLRDIDDIQNPSQISRLQLWVLSKKARVLKMIEDLIRQHNEELATVPPLTDFVSPSSNINLSARLTDIMNTMISSTETVTTRDVEPSSPMTTQSFVINPLSTNSLETTTSGNLETGLTTSSDLVTTGSVPTFTETVSISSSFGSTEASSSTTGSSTGTTAVSTEPSVTVNDIISTTLTTTTDGLPEVLSRLLEGNMATTTVTNIETMETTTEAISTETTTPLNFETTTVDLDTTTGIDASDNNTTQTTVSTLRVGTPAIPKKDYVIFGILPNNTVVRKNPNEDILEQLTEASPYIVYGVLPNNTVIRKFPNGTRVPRVMQKIDILPISPWSLRNPYSPIHNNPAIVRPQPNPIRDSTNTVTSTDTSNNGTERLTNDTVNNQQTMITPSALNIKSSIGITTTNMPEKSTASHVLSLRTTTMLPSIDEILLNSISSAAKQEMVISEMTSSTREPRILTLDIDPETKQIRTEKPGDGEGGAVFKFIPIDEVTVQPQNSNVLKLASTKSPSTNSVQSEIQTMSTSTVTEMSTQTQQLQVQDTTANDATTPTQGTTSVTPETTVVSSAFTNAPVTIPTAITTVPTIAPATTTSEPITTTIITTTVTPVPITTTTTELTTAKTTTTTPAPKTTQAPTTTQATTTMMSTTLSIEEELKRYQEDVQLLQTLLQATGRNPKNLNLNLLGDLTTTLSSANTASTPTTTSATTITNSATATIAPTTTNIPTTIRAPTTANIPTTVRAPTTTRAPATTVTPTTTTAPTTTQTNDPLKLLQALFTNPTMPTTSIPNLGGNLRVSTGQQATTTTRSIEEDIKQFEEDTKLLQALLKATGQNPAALNIPTLDSLTTLRVPTTTQTTIPPTTTASSTTVTPTTTTRPTTTTQSIEEDVKLLQALLQATGQNPNSLNIPVISGVTSNVRIASNPQTTSLGSNPTTPLNVRPIYTTTNGPVFKTFAPRTVTTTLQPVTDIGISTTFQPFNRGRQPTTTTRSAPTTLTGRRAPVTGFTSTTEMPSSSTFSVEEDLAFLNNLKTVLKTNPNNEDPEAALANRIIALAVERSLNEIQTGTGESVRTGKNIAVSGNNLIASTNRPITTTTVTTTTTTTTTTPRPTTTTQRPTTTTQRLTTTQRPTTTINGPSIEDDIRQFQEDTKLLQALLKATGQDPSKLNLPTLPILNVSPKLPNAVNDDLKLLSNLLASPSPLNEPFDPLTPKPPIKNNVQEPISLPTTPLPYGAKIAVKDDLKSEKDDEKLLQTLIKLQGAQETTTQKSKLAITGQSSDEALKKLIQQTQPTGMVSEATRAPISLSTEYGKSNDALLAALLKEQGFGPTTASSLDEQLRLAALLNQVVVTPKTRRTTTPPPPPPAPRRPILDGLAWLWQQWRETAPGPGGAERPNRGPAPSPAPSARPAPSVASSTSGNRVNWFGSGPFVGNADDRPTNRIPLEPPRAVTAEQSPGRGQLVSAAINVTRAFSQFLGAAIQGAAQTVQSVIRAGQRAATDAYVSGSGGSG